jgi:hypothetical protein
LRNFAGLSVWLFEELYVIAAPAPVAHGGLVDMYA